MYWVLHSSPFLSLPSVFNCAPCSMSNRSVPSESNQFHIKCEKHNIMQSYREHRLVTNRRSSIHGRFLVENDFALAKNHFSLVPFGNDRSLSVNGMELGVETFIPFLVSNQCFSLHCLITFLYISLSTIIVSTFIYL